MPLELYVTSQDDPRVLESVLLEAHAPGMLIRDFSSDPPEVIALECYDNDGGGKIMFMPPEGVLDIQDEHDEMDEFVDHLDFPPPHAIIHLAEGGIHEQGITDSYNQRLELVVRQVGSDAITSNFLIPRNLIHPS